MAIMTIDNVLSPAELQMLLASSRVPAAALDRAQDLERTVSGAMVSGLLLIASAVGVWDTALLLIG